MDISKIIWGVTAGAIVGFVTYLVLWGLGFPTQPWAMIFGVLVFLGYVFSGGFPARRL